ncbi:hypothetical protein LIER_34884 [Lithospermum erythrorhizon]|uniref:Tf2-1-like SH3-like domain-containing protein n=1 Tax=Lithospermum erythrorhizon TaxID=34254 RepID=A0AAV3S3H3_LITER
MSPFEALYGRRCRTQVCWNEVRDKKIYGFELVEKSVERIKLIQQHLRTAQDRQKKYADRRRIELSFEIGDKVFLRISPWKSVLRFGKKGKLSPRYIGPYEIIAKVGLVPYRITLPPELQRIHNVFHVTCLRKYIPDESHILKSHPIELKEDLINEEHLVKILDRREKVLRNKIISLVKVLWRNQRIEEATWEREEDVKIQLPYLFSDEG